MEKGTLLLVTSSISGDVPDEFARQGWNVMAVDKLEISRRRVSGLREKLEETEPDAVVLELKSPIDCRALAKAGDVPRMGLAVNLTLDTELKATEVGVRYQLPYLKGAGAVEQISNSLDHAIRIRKRLDDLFKDA